MKILASVLVQASVLGADIKCYSCTASSNVGNDGGATFESCKNPVDGTGTCTGDETGCYSFDTLILQHSDNEGENLETVTRGCVKDFDGPPLGHGCIFTEQVETCTTTCTTDLCNNIPAGGPCSETDPLLFLKDWSSHMAPLFNFATEASWAYNTDINKDNQDAMNAANAEVAQWIQSTGQCAKDKFQDNLDMITDEVGTEGDAYGPQLWTADKQKRAFGDLMNLGTAALSAEDYVTYSGVLSDMSTIYSTAKVPDETVDGLMDSLDPDITAKLNSAAPIISAESYETQRYYYENWNVAAGRPCKDDYTQYVTLGNQAAVLNNFKDMGEMWRAPYEDDKFQDTVEKLWKDVKPLYEKIHGYVRYTMNQAYGDERVSADGPMPAHFFGNMWAQDWSSIYPLVTPFPDAGERPDATPALQDKSVDWMFKTADKFFTDLGMFPMTPTFWNSSVFEELSTDMVCHASAWDFYVGDGNSADQSVGDYRIKQCTQKTQKEFTTVHHEMGHIQYYQQYAHQPLSFRTGANPGWHEAVGDTIALAVNTPKHLNKVGLLPDWSPDQQSDDTDINYLMQTALSKLTFLPFGYLVDNYRWKVFDGTITPDQYQSGWDQIRLEYQGLVSPIPRADSDGDFDAAGKFHVPNDTPYIRYFVSFIVQFQFYEKMCIAAGEFGGADQKLFNCDFDGNKAAGKMLSDALMLGNSQPWTQTMKEVFDIDQMDASSLINYFKPLTDWLDTQENSLGYTSGWDEKSTWTPCQKADCPDMAGGSPTDAPTTKDPSGSAQTCFASFSIALFSLFVYFL